MTRSSLTFPIAAVALLLALGLLVYAGPKGGSSMDKAGTVGKWGEAEKLHKDGKLERATFAAGCFWGVEATFRKLDGVTATRVGYIGGTTENPTYEQVCSHKTGHAEAVDVLYDPKKITYEKLLDVFFTSHDPTTKNRQGPDVGSQYRSGVFYHNEAQKKAAEAARARHQESDRIGKPIVTEITEAPTFWPAEAYHQQYFEKQGGGACHF